MTTLGIFFSKSITRYSLFTILEGNGGRDVTLGQQSLLSDHIHTQFSRLTASIKEIKLSHRNITDTSLLHHLFRGVTFKISPSTQLLH